MNRDTTPSPSPATDQPPIPFQPNCPSCNLPGDLRQTPGDGAVLLEHNDPAAPLTAADVPIHYRWIPIGHHAARRLPGDVDPTTVCQVEHALVCPSHAFPPLRSARLRERHRLNMDRARCASDRFQDGDVPDF
ncbi:DUF6083 domain-containing protein [Streptomyces sp. NPDC006307]|uniref:DUF6083 domain-containing protein n=1 Tax=Streptomyces sp. NPDC006307 TaxID=3156748 RepID=UPI0033A10594